MDDVLPTPDPWPDGASVAEEDRWMLRAELAALVTGTARSALAGARPDVTAIREAETLQARFLAVGETLRRLWRSPASSSSCDGEHPLRALSGSPPSTDQVRAPQVGRGVESPSAVAASRSARSKATKTLLPGSADASARALASWTAS